MIKKWKLFEVFGQELEYMIVDRDSLEIRPFADKLLTDEKGLVQNDIEHGKISWSNELAMHILEFKLTEPAPIIEGNNKFFHDNVIKANKILESVNAMLLPTAMHPLFVPDEKAKLWPFGLGEIYRAYDKIFNCQGHGWLNLQSAHLNIPFGNEEEFDQLHSAIRFVLPLIPALAASSPIVEGKFGNVLDNRLKFYANNQAKFKEISGQIIPEIIGSIEEYYEKILEPMYKSIAPFDDNKILQEEWLNSRGAIARFDRSAIEIRIVDTQESPLADEAVAVIILEFVKFLIEREKNNFINIKNFSQENLVEIYKKCISFADMAFIDDAEYLQILEISKIGNAREIWLQLIDNIFSQEKKERYNQFLKVYQDGGSLATRIKTDLWMNSGFDNIRKIYKNIGKCLVENSIHFKSEL